MCTETHVQILGGWQTVYMKQRVQSRLKPLRKNLIRQWRERRELTLEQLVERLAAQGLEITHASLSHDERSLQPYNQRQLEAIVTELNTDPASLLMRNPQDPDAIWTIWDQAKPGERRQIAE